MAVSSSLDHLSNRMKLEWHSKLNTEMVPAKNFRRTSIIGTIGKSGSCWHFFFYYLMGEDGREDRVANVRFFFFSRPQDQLDR